MVSSTISTACKARLYLLYAGKLHSAEMLIPFMAVRFWLWLWDVNVFNAPRDMLCKMLTLNRIAGRMWLLFNEFPSMSNGVAREWYILLDHELQHTCLTGV